jgi:hypothetical protein
MNEEGRQKNLFEKISRVSSYQLKNSNKTELDEISSVITPNPSYHPTQRTLSSSPEKKTQKFSPRLILTANWN